MHNHIIPLNSESGNNNMASTIHYLTAISRDPYAKLHVWRMLTMIKRSLHYDMLTLISIDPYCRALLPQECLRQLAIPSTETRE